MMLLMENDKKKYIFISFTLDIIGHWANTMLKENYTEVTEFVLLGLTDWVELQPVLSVVFLVIYLITVFGNVSMILLIRADSKLQTPIYFFLRQLSFVDLCYAPNVMPQMLVNLLSKRKTISFLGCFIQFDFFISLGFTDSYMLTAMAYDLYMASCKPLLYGIKCPIVSASLSLLHLIFAALQTVLHRPPWCSASPSVDPRKSTTSTVQTHLS